MKVALLIGRESATLVCEAETVIEREVFAELKRRGMKLTAEFGPEPECSPETPAANNAALCRDAATDGCRPAIRRNSVMEMATGALPDFAGGVFDSRGLRDVLMRKFPQHSGKIVAGIYPVISRLLLANTIKRVPGGFQATPGRDAATPTGAVPTATAEPVAQS